MIPFGWNCTAITTALVLAEDAYIEGSCLDFILLLLCLEYSIWSEAVAGYYQSCLRNFMDVFEKFNQLSSFILLLHWVWIFRITCTLSTFRLYLHSCWAASILLPPWWLSRGGTSARSLIHAGTLGITWRVHAKQISSQGEREWGR